MSRKDSMPASVVRESFALESADDYIALMELDFDGLEGGPLRFSRVAVQRIRNSSGEDELDDYGAPVYGYVHRGKTYYYLPFDMAWPEASPDKPPSSTMSISNMTRELTPYVDQIRGPGRVRLIVTHTAAPDWEEVYSGLLLTDITGESESLSGELTVDMAMDDAFPCHTYDPAHWPGLH